MPTKRVVVASCALRVFAVLAGVLLVMTSWAGPVRADPDYLPHRPWVAGFGGLCDAGPLVCTRMDELAFNGRIDAVLLTSTDQRGIGLVAPYGFSFGLLQRVEGGVYTHSGVWEKPEGGDTRTGFEQGPMRFALKGLLWPWRRDPHQHFAVLLDFEYEARLPRFDGPNQLGLLTNLGALRAVVNLPLGGAELGLSVGALFDWHGRYGTAELGLRVGWHLPFLPDLKVFAEGAARGLFVRVNTTEPIPGALDPARPIVPGGVLGLGISLRHLRAVDFAMGVHVGFGGTAPFFLTLRFADIAWGKGYPRPRSLVVDAARELALWVQEQVASIDPMFNDQCVMIDDAPPHGTGGSMSLIGRKTPDGGHCLWNGLWLKKHRNHQKIEYWKNKRGTLLCHDRARDHCFARRASTEEPWEAIENPAHRAVLRGDCIFEDADTKQRLTHFGKLTPERQSCTDGKSTVPVGQYVGYEPALHQIDLGLQGQHRWSVLAGYTEPTALQRLGTALGRGIEDGQQENKQAEDDQKAAAAAGDAKLGAALKTVEEMTAARLISGVEVAEQEAADELRHAGADPKGTFSRALDRIRHGIEDTAGRIREGVKSSAQDAISWSKKPAMEQAEDILKLGGRKAATAHRDGTEHVAIGLGMGAAGHVVSGVAGQVTRPGQPFTKGGKKEVWSRNAAKNAGTPKCDSCGVEVIKPQKHTKAVTPPAHEGQVDHMTARSKGGSGTPDNGQLLCRDCNLEKSNR